METTKLSARRESALEKEGCLVVQEPPVAEPFSPLLHRAARFAGRVCLTLALCAGATALFQYEMRLAGLERAFDHPLLVALDEIGASIFATEIGMWTKVGEGPPPTMETLKRMAERTAGDAVHREGVEMWSEVHDAYRVVYFKGPEALGGAWIASARYVETEGGRGVTEVAYRRELIGRFDGIRAAQSEMRARLLRVPGASFGDVRGSVRIVARPGADGAWPAPGAILTSFFEALEARNVSTHLTEAEATGSAYAPRLAVTDPGVRPDKNVEVRIADLGRAPLIEVGAPAL